MRIAARARLVGLLLLGLAACAAGRDWPEFRMPGGDFAVSVPGKPEVYKDVIEKDGGVWRVYDVDQGSVDYSIDYYVSGTGRKAGSLDGRLDALRDAVVRSVKGKLRNERRFSLGETRAAEMIIDVPEKDQSIKARFYVRHDQAGRDISYKTWVVGPPGYDANPNTARFLDSFHFIGG
jgi:hypothetical protein